MFYFAWASPAETTFGPEHQVEDEEVFAFELTHAEGDFPALSIDIKNPRVGLLKPGRDVWAWLSYNDGATVTPLFFGRLVGVPEDMQDEVVRLAFIARPTDYDAQKRALAASMRVLPYYDPVWIVADRRDDPDAVLEGYARLWHIDRVTHDVTASDILTGEDGTVDFSGGFFYDSLSVTYGSAPARRIQVTAEVFWDQAATGSVDLSGALIDAFKVAGTTVPHAITSLTGGGLTDDWPVEGKRIGGGWTVGQSEVVRTDGVVVDQEFVTVVVTDAAVDFPVWTMKPTLFVDYEASRQKSEKVTFTLEADVQAVVTEPGDEEVMMLTLASQDIDAPIDAGDALPIGDVRRRAYFTTDRGKQSVENLIALARARLLGRARTVEVSFDVPFADALGLSCRKNASISDARLPGGQAAGKIIGYSLSCDGDNGELAASVTIGCSVGQGNTVTAVPGSPDYVEDGYVDDGWQTRTGQLIMPIAGEVAYQDFSSIAPNDDGVDFFDMTAATCLEQMTVINGEAAQRAVFEAIKHADPFIPDVRGAVDALNEVFTEVDMDLKVLKGGPFHTDYAVTVSGLMVPKTVDLEAA